MSIDTALQNLMSILYCLEDEALICWTKKELAGYNFNDELPAYRKISGRVLGNFFVGYMKYTKHQIPINHLDEDIRKALLEVPIYSSISTLSSTVEKDSNLCKALSPEFYASLQRGSNANITSAYVDIDTTALTDIISKVKSKVLETLLFLEKEFGCLDNLDIDISSKNEVEIKSIVYQIQVNLYDNSISIGDNNKIKNSDILTNK